MRKVLRLTTSILGTDSVSNTLMDTLLEKMGQSGEPLELSERNFSNTPIPHLDGEWLQALMTAEADRDEQQQTKADFSNALVAELMAADILVIGLPMYNFSVPSMLKAWIDHVARAGVTFKYTESGPVGLLAHKKVYLVTAMGGKHVAGEGDFLRPYVRHILGFLGITDVNFITADGLAMGDEPRAEGLARAEQEIAVAVEEFKQRAHNSEHPMQEEAA